MGRQLTEDGECYRHVIVYVERDKPGDTLKKYFGPYDTPGPGKAAGTMWMGKYWHDRHILVERYNEITDVWRRA